MAILAFVRAISPKETSICQDLFNNYGKLNKPNTKNLQLTYKEISDIQQVLEELSNQNILIIQDGCIVEFYKDRAWNLVINQIFFKDRRTGKRNATTCK